MPFPFLRNKMPHTFHCVGRLLLIGDHFYIEFAVRTGAVELCKVDALVILDHGDPSV